MMSARSKNNLVTSLWGDIPPWAYAAVGSLIEGLKVIDAPTAEHCLRVGEYSRLLAKSAGLSEYQQKVAEFSGILHDVGKIGVGSTIINKPAKLTVEEYHIMQEHSIYSEQMIKPLGTHEFFQQVIPAVRGHHERLDGLGYPDKLSGDDIPLISRVILIVDTLDAMAQDRPYRKGLPLEAIYKELERCAGTQFDQALVKIFLEAHHHWAKEKPDAETVHFLKKAI
jgi:HD-GYP domain-containing protein (c-di-GMP phosphodiesterase class II)